MATGQQVSQGIVANPILLAWIKRFLPHSSDINTAYQAAGTAYSKRLSEVTITTSAFEGGNAAGQISGDPSEMMAACEIALQDLESLAEGGVGISASGANHFDFSTRRVGT